MRPRSEWDVEGGGKENEAERKEKDEREEDEGMKKKQQQQKKKQKTHISGSANQRIIQIQSPLTFILFSFHPLSILIVLLSFSFSSPDFATIFFTHLIWYN